LATIVETQFSFIATCQCIAYSLCYNGGNKLTDPMLFGVLGAVLAVWIAALGTFLLSVNRAYLPTFYSLETGPQFAERQFLHHLGNDEVRMVLFTHNERLWSSSLRTAVTAWAHASYVAWTSQAWFTADVKELIPTWAIPNLLNIAMLAADNLQPESAV
jgi:hypothetical protein